MAVPSRSVGLTERCACAWFVGQRMERGVFPVDEQASVTKRCRKWTQKNPGASRRIGVLLLIWTGPAVGHMFRLFPRPERGKRTGALNNPHRSGRGARVPDGKRPVRRARLRSDARLSQSKGYEVPTASRSERLLEKDLRPPE